MNDDDEGNDMADVDSSQPEWMQVMKPNLMFDDFQNDIPFDDGGPDYDWTKTTYSYPDDLGKSWIEQLNETSDIPPQNEQLIIPDVQLSSLNDEQCFAFNIVMQTLLNFIGSDTPEQVRLLRMVVSGTAGSGKSYLIQCIVKGVRTLFQSNDCVQVVCPTGNSANLISGVT